MNIGKQTTKVNVVLSESLIWRVDEGNIINFECVDRLAGKVKGDDEKLSANCTRAEVL